MSPTVSNPGKVKTISYYQRGAYKTWPFLCYRFTAPQNRSSAINPRHTNTITCNHIWASALQISRHRWWYAVGFEYIQGSCFCSLCSKNYNLPKRIQIKREQNKQVWGQDASLYPCYICTIMQTCQWTTIGSQSHACLESMQMCIRCVSEREWERETCWYSRSNFRNSSLQLSTMLAKLFKFSTGLPLKART